ncbi:cytochrome c oxidase subunit II [Halorientalis litorea]|uniref:cytochrome c oxidase subunit II n=1 Tax=Halorientalis litorea TaxID=2931977 RepID=UPI001FF512BD|nr:cytochrome c oxidase subunit II [Halorientalis litorea]
MNRKRAGLMGLFSAALLLVAVEPALAQTSTSTTESLIWGLNMKLLYVAIPITILVEGILVYTVWKYSKSDEAKPTQENRRLEITWTIATAVILLFVGVASYQVLGNPYVTASTAQQEQVEEMEQIDVIGQKYIWYFQYDDISAEDVSATGLTLENVSVEGGEVVSTGDDGTVVEGAELTGAGVESATLDSATVSGIDANEGESVSADGVDVSDANISDATLAGASVRTTETMVMPANEDVRLNITSVDWLHAFHVPSLGLKSDAFPEQSNYLQTNVGETGTHQLYCAEYCGTGHSGMLGTVDVRSQNEYQQWLVQQWVEDNQ